MRSASILAALLFLCLLCTNNINAQSYCYTCNYDSLLRVKDKETNVNKKLHLLEMLADKRYDSSVVKEIIQLGATVRSFDVSPYKKVREALAFYNRKEWPQALAAFLEAIELFDRQKKVIPELLTEPRVIYNTLNRQEERLAYYQKKAAYYQVNGPVENVAACFYGIAGYYNVKNDFNMAISYYLKSAELYKPFLPRLFYNHMGVIGTCYSKWGNYEKAGEYLNIALPGYLQLGDTANAAFTYGALARLSLQKGNLKDASDFASLYLKYADSKGNEAAANVILAEIRLRLGQTREALPYLLTAQHLKDSAGLSFYSSSGDLEIDYNFFDYYNRMNEPGKAEKYLLTANKDAEAAQSTLTRLKYLQALSLFYLGHNRVAEAMKYTTAYYSVRDSLENQVGKSRIAQYENELKESEQNNKIALLKQDNAVKQATIKQRNLTLWISSAAILLIIGSMIFLYRQFSINKKTLLSLRKTQKQLVTAEKMASLGELTAGIAHEIQNPLNFVNNFSEVNIELVDEMQQAMKEGNTTDALEISNDIRQNLDKISYHGKRADGIVKNMLQHSRKSSGQKEDVDINSLVDEYLRLSYHGTRARDNAFNAILETHFDPAAGKVSMAGQEIGRVLLNLFNNAFYAVKEKKKSTNGSFEPLVQVTTTKTSRGVEIKIKDNGTGIPERVLDKIYQPFFTTKPTGEGTGLGLSLSYDIVTKGHGGEMKVTTEEGEGTEFVIRIPS